MEEGVSIQRRLLRFYGLVSVVVPTLDGMEADDATGRAGRGPLLEIAYLCTPGGETLPHLPQYYITE